MVEKPEGATQLEKYCALRVAVEELLLALKAKDADGVTAWTDEMAKMLDAEIATYGDEGRECYAAIRAGANQIKWSEQFLDDSHAN